jgi:hypothetical protein
MSERLRKAQRLLAVQTALDRLAEWSLADCERREAELQDRRLELVRFIDSEVPTAGAFPAMMMRHLQQLAERHAALLAEKDAHAERRRGERARLRAAERIVAAQASEAGKHAAKGELAEVIEAMVGRIRQRQG